MTESETGSAASPLDGPTTRPVLQVRNLRKSFGAVAVLDGVDIDLHDGEVLAVLGPSGSGKSTLVKCIHMLESLDGGSVTLDGELLGYEEHRGRLRPMSERAIAQQRSRIGMVFQHFNLVPNWTALRNITEPAIRVHKHPRAEAEERAHHLLREMGLSGKERSYPRQLSGGQQQRVAIARAIATQPRVLLFDEPTSALDPELVGDVLAVIRRLADRGRTMVVVTHEMGFAREVADRCVFMADGRVVETGRPGEFFGNPRSDRLRAFLARHRSDQHERPEPAAQAPA
ncbi:amino acid ABC transporter ATP-binding protein [Nocardia carnea]|uniref:amino acid ABC transporter ATP-binding protein n=1 Tax=Nocardia TaxID=1817 RepID=UPI002456159B|nr:amino acid ABC transporter ATP-binding protein [Nocardia carnea]